MSKVVKGPLVSIACITYNQENYIRQCLDGFVMQKTDFCFEIVIHDDASTDKTPSIIKEYCDKYPDLFVPILQSQNKYKEGKGILVPYVFPKCKGKYIALCEGDDYWIDPLKLQKQVDFLDENPDYSMCFHDACIKNETSTLFNYPPHVCSKDYSSSELFKEWIVPTASILARKEAVFSAVRDVRIINGDINVVLACANHGKVYGMADKMSVYRVQANGLTLSRVKNDNLDLQFRYVKHYECLKENYHKVSSKYYNIKLADTYINIALIYIRRRNLGLCVNYLFSALRKRPLRIIYRLFNKLK